MSGRFTRDAMLGIEEPDPRWERRPLDQAEIDNPRKRPTAEEILAQQREQWPDYAAIRRPYRTREEQMKLALAVLAVAGGVLVLLAVALLRWRVGAAWQ